MGGMGGMPGGMPGMGMGGGMGGMMMQQPNTGGRYSYCDDGHQMQYINTDPYQGEGVTCDLCDRAVPVQYWFQHCYECETDYCQNCGNQRMR